MPLLKRRVPFDDPDWLFELKYDGFRALAVIEHGRARLISRNGHPFAFFADLATDIGDSLRSTRFPCSTARFAQWTDVANHSSVERVCRLDLEGIVAKHKLAPYVTEREQSSWFKIRNRGYSQMAGREELFEREPHSEPVPGPALL